MPGISTTAVHAGERPDPATGSLNTPVIASTTFEYPERADGTTSSHIYSRYDNPTVQAVEGKVAALDGADGALAFASGMAAIACICETFLRPGDTIAVMHGVYGGTTAHLEREVAGRGIHVHAFDAFEETALPEGTKLVWLESITNPLLRVPDVAAWAEVAHAAGARLVVDATFATPILHRPMEEGADLVVHSATKYLGGHSDTTGGIICHRGEDRDELWTTRRNLGATMDPFGAYLVLRGIKTLPIRVREQCATAMWLAETLAARDDVIVHHPGREAHPDHAHARRLAAFGAMLTIDVGSLERAQAFRRKVKLIAPAASLGGVESLVSLPIETSHAYATPEARAALGITGGLLRISVGLEDRDDLLADIEAALA